MQGSETILILCEGKSLLLQFNEKCEGGSVNNECKKWNQTSGIASATTSPSPFSSSSSTLSSSSLSSC